MVCLSLLGKKNLISLGSLSPFHNLRRVSYTRTSNNLPGRSRINQIGTHRLDYLKSIRRMLFTSPDCGPRAHLKNSPIRFVALLYLAQEIIMRILVLIVALHTLVNEGLIRHILCHLPSLAKDARD